MAAQVTQDAPQVTSLGPEACPALLTAGLASAGITTATYTAAGSGGGAGPAAQALPAHCVVCGAIAPRTGADGKHGATIAAAWDTITYLSMAPAGADGRPILSRALSNAELDLVSQAILSSCDAADGATDGMVQRPDTCRFDAAALRCQGPKTAACLSTAQIAAITPAFDGPQDSTGRRLYTGQLWDPGISAPGWRQWKLGSSETSTPNAANTTLMAGALAHEFFTPPDPSFVLTQFNFDRDPGRMEAFSREYDTYRDAALAAFKASAGKFLIFHGTADPIFSARESIEYYQRLAMTHGGVAPLSTWARLFLVPGMNHCSGGPATDSFDGLGAIVDWVERGTAPDRVLARAPATSRYFPNRSRPLCPFPTSARYAGTGSIEDAENFTCAP